VAPPTGISNPQGLESIPTQVLGNDSLTLSKQVPADSLLADAYNNMPQSVVRITNTRNPATTHTWDRRAFGSGFVATQSGQVVTDLHVVQNSQSLQVQIGSQSYPAHVIRTLADSDLALLQIDSPNRQQQFKPLELAASSDILQGERVAAFGYPEGSPTLYFSPGTFSQRLQLSQLLARVDGGLMPGEDPKRPIDESNMSAQGGNSGGPFLKRDFDGRWRVAGIVDMSDAGSRHVDTTPVEAIRRLLGPTYEPGSTATIVAGNTPLFGMRGQLPFNLRFALAPNTVAPTSRFVPGFAAPIPAANSFQPAPLIQQIGH